VLTQKEQERRSRCDLVRNLVAKEVKVRYMGSLFGFFWALGNPAFTIITYLIVFTWIIPVTKDRFALHLMTGIFHWMLFAQIVSQSCEWLTNNKNLLQKINFPRLLLPVSAALTVGVFWVAAMAVYCVVFPMIGGVVTSALLWYPLILVCFITMIFGIGLILSVLHVVYRDVKPLVDVLVPLLCWLTPVIWIKENLSQDVQRIVSYNPLAPFFSSFSSILHRGVPPQMEDVLLCVGIAVVSIVIGLVCFTRKVDFLVELL